MDKKDNFQTGKNGKIINYTCEYEKKPTKTRALNDFKKWRQNFKDDSKFKEFTPQSLVIYPFCWGWTTGYKTHFSISKKPNTTGFPDEINGKRKEFIL